VAALGRLFECADVQTEGAYFLDRDPKHFQLVLNFMRDGTCELPTSAVARREILAEARYYQVCPLSCICKRVCVFADLLCSRRWMRVCGQWNGYSSM
jgi:hypothetical protein